ncbi:MAG TPA: LytTR family DNA-binding domain-containing protein [Candidatus Paceibacterota bacterium]|nr:LytTR family DNA-binding domain-containing protein [Candidatus Paceibacterota bacterium]
MHRLKCLIIDDEPLAQNIIENYLKNVSFIELIAKCDNALSAMTWIKKQKIDLIFLDISMPFISGIDFIKTLQNPPAVILTTAHKEFAVESYELNVLDYLLKPISFERFLKAINKLDNEGSKDIKPVIDDSGSDTFIYVKSEKKNVKILLKEILFIESLKDYIKIQTITKSIITQVPISAIEQRLPESFLRIHRSFIVARDKITAYTQHDFEIGKYQIPIGRNYKSAVSKMFNLPH